MRTSKLSLFLALLFTSTIALCQAPPLVSIDSVDTSGLLNLQPANDATPGNFAKVLNAPVNREYRPYALVLENTSNRGLIAVTLKWTAKSGDRMDYYISGADSVSAVGFGSMSMTSNLAPHAPNAEAPRSIGSTHTTWADTVASTGERLLVAPTFFLRESDTERHNPAIGFANVPEKFLSADSITVSLEAAVFDDGQVIGDNPQPTIDAFKAGRAALDDLIAKLHAGIAAGEDATVVLARLSRQTPTAHDPQTNQERIIARQLLVSSDWMKELERMTAKQLPNFHQ